MSTIIVLATTNANKVAEMRRILEGYPVRLTSLADYGPLPPIEEDGATFDDMRTKGSLNAAIWGLARHLGRMDFPALKVKTPWERGPPRE